MEQTTSDTELLERVRNSDVDAFRTLFERYQPMVFRQSLFFTGQVDLAHDIVQETFVRVWETRRSLKPHLSFPAYALRISRNLVWDRAKHQKVRQRLDTFIPQASPSAGDNPEEAFFLVELEERISRIVKNDLPERCRMVFVLSRFEGKSNQEIAKILRISVRTVEHQINRALKVLRRTLRGWGE